MRTHRMLGILALSLSLGGCNSLSPTQRYALNSNAYSTAVEGVTNASRLDLVDLEFLEGFNEVRAPARAGIDEWEDALMSGENLSSTKRRRISGLIDRLILMHIQAKRGGDE